jgi:hypothetical protein
MLPKLCFWITAYTTSDKPFTSLAFRILKDTETLLEAAVPPEDIKRLAESQSPPLPSFESDPLETFTGVGAALAITPFQVDRPHMLRIRVQTESEELKGIGLQVLQTPVPVPQ